MPNSGPVHTTSPIQTVLVVGAGLAATALVGELRAKGFAGTITVVGDESPYDRPPLTKHLFTLTSPGDLREQFSLGADAAVWKSDTVTSVSPQGEVTIAGATCRADAVVIAVGARPATSASWTGVRTVATWPEVRALRESLVPGARLVIAGAGWIGLELASSAVAAGVHVTVVEGTGLPLGSVVPAAVGRRIARWLDGVTFVTGTVAAASGTALELTSGTSVRGDVVVAAVGARPATALVPAAWRMPGGHIRTDAAGRVAGAPGVWAIGDCAAPLGAPDQHWNAAVAAARRCAHAMLGSPVPPIPPPHVFSAMFGHDVHLVGRTSPDLTVLWRAGDGWTALLLDRERLVGGVVVDRPRDVAALRRILAEGTPRLHHAAAVDPTRSLTDALKRQ